MSDKKGDLDGAIADYDTALIFEPRLARVYNMRGSARYNQGDLDGSIADYTRAIEINPRLSSALNNRGNVRREKGDLDGAIADSDTASRPPLVISTSGNHQLSKLPRIPESFRRGPD